MGRAGVKGGEGPGVKGGEGCGVKGGGGGIGMKGRKGCPCHHRGTRCEANPCAQATTPPSRTQGTPYPRFHPPANKVGAVMRIECSPWTWNTASPL
eukprot:scaffold11007_cov88-Isochrysis_galbana.AAC.1